MITDFEHWNTHLGEVSQLEELKGTRVGIEAAHFLDNRMLNHSGAQEPLVPALGGSPLGLFERLTKDLDVLDKHQIQPFFVFSGLDITKQEDPFRQRREGVAVNNHAWTLYNAHKAEESVAKFRESGQAFTIRNKACFAHIPQDMSLQRTSIPRSRPSW